MNLRIFVIAYFVLGAILFHLVSKKDRQITGWKLYHKRDSVKFMLFSTVVTYALWPLVIWIRYMHVLEGIRNAKASKQAAKELAAALRNKQHGH